MLRETTTLSVDDVIKLIFRRECPERPTRFPSTSIAIFQGLSENAILSGDVLETGPFAGVALFRVDH